VLISLFLIISLTLFNILFVMLLLLSVPTAMEYYPKLGFKKQESSFIMERAAWKRTE